MVSAWMLPVLEKLPSPLANLYWTDRQRCSPPLSVSLQNIPLHLKQDRSGTSFIERPDPKTSICADKMLCASFRSTEIVPVSGGLLCANECTVPNWRFLVFRLAARSPRSVLPVLPLSLKERSCPLPMGSCCRSCREHFCKRSWVTLNIFSITCLHHVPENPVLYEILGPDVTSGWSHTGFFKLVTKHSSEDEIMLGESECRIYPCFKIQLAAQPWRTALWLCRFSKVIKI